MAKLTPTERSARIKAGIARTKMYQSKIEELNLIFKMFDTPFVAYYANGKTAYPNYRFHIYGSSPPYRVYAKNLEELAIRVNEITTRFHNGEDIV